MALHDMLSAMREILLDLERIPDSETERRALYGTRFAGLAPEELDDLVKIPAEKLGIYKQTIFRKEASVLRIHFKGSLACVQRAWKQASGGRKFHRVDLMRRIHAVRPWRDAQTVTLAENFRSYVKYDFPELVVIEPWLADLIELEFANMLIKRLPDGPLTPGESLQPEDLAALTVDELLSLSFSIPPVVQMRKFSFAVLRALREFYSNDLTMPTAVPLLNTWALGGRTKSHLPEWVEVGPRFFERIAHLSQMPEALHSLAEAFLADADPAVSEETLFAQFVTLLLDLVRAGVIVLYRSPADPAVR